MKGIFLPLSITISLSSFAKDDLNFLDKYEEKEKLKKDKQIKKNKYLDCMINKIKPETTEAHKSVVKQYCQNKVSQE